MEKQEFESLTLCPLDGRYSGIKNALGEYFSEYALVKYRVYVEIQWLKFLIENGSDYRQNNDFLFRKSITLKNPEFIQYLITKGVDINSNNGEILKNALKFSVVDPVFFDIAKVLLDNGADFSLVEDEVISFIAYHYDEDTINFILKNIPEFNGRHSIKMKHKKRIPKP